MDYLGVNILIFLRILTSFFDYKSCETSHLSLLFEDNYHLGSTLSVYFVSAISVRHNNQMDVANGFNWR